MAYLNKGDGNEENKEGKGKDQEGWQKKFLITQFSDRDSIHLGLAFDTEDVLGIEFNLIDIYPQFRQYTKKTRDNVLLKVLLKTYKFMSQKGNECL